MLFINDVDPYQRHRKVYAYHSGKKIVFAVDSYHIVREVIYAVDAYHNGREVIFAVDF